MGFSVSWLCFLLLCLVAFNDAWLFGPIGRSRSRRRLSIRITRCDSKQNCVSCTKHKSWSGQPCRWCPRDKKCHAHGAVFTNPCSRTENVVSASACNSIVTPNYDSSLAFKMVYLSALAYTDNVAKKIPRATEVGWLGFTMGNKSTLSTIHGFFQSALQGSRRWSISELLTLIGRRKLHFLARR